MKRREFLVFATTVSAAIPLLAQTSTCPEREATGVHSYSQGFTEIRHQHKFEIPLQYLIDPPKDGYTARCSTPVKGQTDFEGLKNRTDSNGQPLDLRGHAHTVLITQDQLLKLSNGYHVTIDLEKFGHRFYFVANDATLQTVRAKRKPASEENKKKKKS